MNIKLDPMFDTMGQAFNKMHQTMGVSPKNPDPFNRLDFQFDTSRQAHAKILERIPYNPPRTSPGIPTPLEELQMHKPPEPPKFGLPKPVEPSYFVPFKKPWKI